LARVAGTLAAESSAIAAEDVGHGETALTPVMLDLIERAGSVGRAGSQSMLVVVPAGLDVDRLTDALQRVMDRHDVLRARLEMRSDGAPEDAFDGLPRRLVIPEPGAAGAVAAREPV